MFRPAGWFPLVRRGGHYRRIVTREEENRRRVLPGGIDALRTELMAEREKLEVERARSRHLETEAVLRASTVAGSLLSEVLAAQRLATAVERHLRALRVLGKEACEEISDALEFFQEVRRER